MRSVREATGEGSNERPVNILTSAVDLDGVYGPSEERNEVLMEGSGSTGKMDTSSGDLLKLNTENLFNAPSSSAELFVAGDHRPNEHLVLLAFHTVWLREHNRLIDELKSRRRNLSGNQLYEYARKLNIAQFQKVVFEEFYNAIAAEPLPPYTGFKRGVNPAVSDIFGGAAFRVGHTLIGDGITLKDANGDVSVIPPSEMFFAFTDVVSSTLDSALRGAVSTQAQELDNMVVDTLRNMLFEHVEGEEGFDLIALNIQRSRDHALPTFTEIQEIFPELTTARRFTDITRLTDVAEKLSTAYDGNITEVEAWPGMMCEDHLPGGGMGPTMETVWKHEFIRLRDGDQFFYLNTDAFPSALRNIAGDLIAEIQDPSTKCLRRILLDNTALTEADLPADVFKVTP